MDSVPEETVAWLTEPDSPAVATLTRRTLLGDDGTDVAELWERRNSYPPIADILDAMQPDGSWDVPSRDYQKYRGTLWQIVLLGELYASPDDERVQVAAEHAFERQMDDGSWSASNRRAAGSLPCLTANVARGLARMGYAEDERVLAALEHCVDLYRELGVPECRQMSTYHLNGYCHMLTPKLLLFLGEVPREQWPGGAFELRDECVERLCDKRIHFSLPAQSREFEQLWWETKPAQRDSLREQFIAEHPNLEYGEKPGWKRFGYPLSYNSDALEALAALAAVGEPMHAEFEPALTLVREQADPQMRWKLRNSLNGKMYSDIEKKGAPSKWLTLRALQVLDHFGDPAPATE